MTDGNKNFMSGGTSPAASREENGGRSARKECSLFFLLGVTRDFELICWFLAAGDSGDGREPEAAAVPSRREITREACIVPGGAVG